MLFIEENAEGYFWDNSLLSASHTKEDDLLHQETPAINMTYLLDPLGSPLHFCNAEGGIEESYGYDAFGEDLYTQEDNTAVQSIDRMQPFGFTGYERDDISGLYYAQARRYDAGTGRFTSRDMIKGQVSHMQSQNEYAYCLGNPLLYVDRDGKIPTVVIGTVVGAIIPLIFDVVTPLIEGEELDGSDIIIDTFTGATVGAVAGTGVGIGWIILFSGSISSLNYTAKKIANGDFVEEYDTAEMIVSSIVSMVTALIGGAYGKPSSWASTTVWEFINNLISWLSTDPKFESKENVSKN